MSRAKDDGTNEREAVAAAIADCGFVVALDNTERAAERLMAALRQRGLSVVSGSVDRISSTPSAILGLHPQAIREANQAIDDAVDWGSVDFGLVCEQVLEMEDSPQKARCLARVGGFALWYAHNLREEETGFGSTDPEESEHAP